MEKEVKVLGLIRSVLAMGAMGPQVGVGGAEDAIYTHTTYIRDVAFVRDEPGRWHLRFSEACGAYGDGKIYRIEDDGTVSLFFEVPLEEVGGFWAGDFAFNPFNSLVLYLSSGNKVPAHIYRVSESGMKGSTPIRAARSRASSSYPLIPSATPTGGGRSTGWTSPRGAGSWSTQIPSGVGYPT